MTRFILMWDLILRDWRSPFPVLGSCEWFGAYQQEKRINQARFVFFTALSKAEILLNIL